MQLQIDEHIKLVNELNLPNIASLAHLIRSRIITGHKVLIFGNGGSAADAQHFAAELIGRFKKERPAMPAIALTTDTSIITAIGNDYGFDKIFSRQLEGLLNIGDIVIAISTSGNSKNCIEAVEYAMSVEGVKIIALTGQAPNKLCTLAHFCVSVNSTTTARVQEVHELVLHLIAEKIEE